MEFFVLQQQKVKQIKNSKIEKFQWSTPLQEAGSLICRHDRLVVEVIKGTRMSGENDTPFRDSMLSDLSLPNAIDWLLL